VKLHASIEHYIQYKHAKGYVFEKGQFCLHSFLGSAGNMELNQIEPQHILHYLEAAHTSVITWRLKYQILSRFFKFRSHRGQASELLMPLAKPHTCQTFVPHIYNRCELRRLLAATKANDTDRSRIDGRTMRTLILLLYGTGALTSEVLDLQLSDVDLHHARVLIRGRGPFRFRQIPVGQDLLDVLRGYVSWRSRKKYFHSILLVTKDDQPIRKRSANRHFERIRRIASVGRQDCSRFQPRMQDLKYSFATHRIAAWIEAEADLNRLLPALAAYMGQVGLGSTERYLRMTPSRFSKHLNKLSRARRMSHWRDDPVLMQFLQCL
jgi:site-specific recombinase XerD